ncbi:hypothetical protein RF55_12719 [Lasius niger]|uniref:Uncharacterized protein n=1 Tax=Lasius niger TaxID=67767 RepID=A0A0J7KCC3_LASNI|nr:hypothetical protein RF55_12733 [Lasius niger]KMQ87879.1 hypothetical protein RF55_12719 [Lasius niger]
MDRQAEIEALFGAISDESSGDEKPRPVNPPKPSAEPDIRKPAKLPRPGTSVQRSDADQRRKAIFLMSPPPPRPKRRSATTTRPTPAPGAAPPTRPTPPSRPPPFQPTPPAPTRTSICAISRPGVSSPTVTSTSAGSNSGNRTPPPILVALADGHTVAVPFYSATISRRFRATSPTGRWLIRFDRRSQPRMIRRLEDKKGVV